MIYSGWTDKNGDSIAHQEFGVYINPENPNEWSNMPYNKEQKKVDKARTRFNFILDKIIVHLNRTNRGFKEELELIRQKKSTLPKYCRDFLLDAI